jgi:hypothetical protein
LPNPFQFRVKLIGGTYVVYNLTAVSVNTGFSEIIGVSDYVNRTNDNYNLTTNAGNKRLIVVGTYCRNSLLTSQDVSNAFAEAYTPQLNACTYDSGEDYRVNQALYNGYTGFSDHYFSHSPNRVDSIHYCQGSASVIEFTDPGEIPLGKQFYFQRENYGSILENYYDVPFQYLPQVFTKPTDQIGVYQCAGENYDVPDCNNLTFIASTTLWSSYDINNYDGDPLLLDISGNNVFPIEAPATTTYRTYTAFAKSELFGDYTFGPEYFSINWTDFDIENVFSSGEYDRDYWCSESNVCNGIATTTFGGIINCGLQRSICWAFAVSSSSKGYFNNSFNILKTRFPFSLYFDITEAFQSLATSTSEVKGFSLPVPAVGQDGKATITMENLISSSTVKTAIGANNYSNIREAIVWFAWILAAGYILIRLNHKHI